MAAPLYFCEFALALGILLLCLFCVVYIIIFFRKLQKIIVFIFWNKIQWRPYEKVVIILYLLVTFLVQRKKSLAHNLIKL